MSGPRTGASSGIPDVGLVAPLPPQVGGVASVAEWLLAHAAEIGCRYSTFDLARPSGPAAGGSLRTSSVLHQARLLAAYVRWLRRSPRIIHYAVSLTGTGLTRDAAFVLLARAAGRRVVAHVHGAGLEEIRPGSFRGALLRLVGRSSVERVAIAPRLAERLGRLGVPAKAILNPVRVRTDTSRDARGDDEPPSLLFVGTYGARKGCPELVRALSLARADGVDAVLVFAGKEERAGEEATLRGLVASLELADSVTFAGVVEPDGLAALYADSSVFCLPSLREGLPMALLEAMAAGLPAITTPVGGIPDVVEHGRTGLLVEPGDVGELATAITALATDRSLRRKLGSAARRRVLAVAGDVELAGRWRDVYSGSAGRRFQP